MNISYFLPGTTAAANKKMRFPFEPGFGLLSGTVINTETSLAAVLPVLKAAHWIAIDTEADSLHAYPEKLCLIQISHATGDVLLDPLSPIELQPRFFNILHDHQLIFHGADYDLRLLKKTFDFVPTRIFDTMLAARLLGYEQFGLSNLVARVLGIELEKGPQKMDWARRPLTPRMETYARNDTVYLKPLSDFLKAELNKTGRLAWQEELCARLIADSSQIITPDPDEVWRLKGSDRLSHKAQTLLRELWWWREGEARESNKPPFFVVEHHTLTRWACELADGKTLQESLGSRRMSSGRTARLTSVVERALQIPQENYARPRARKFHRRLKPAEHARFEELKAHRDKVALGLGIDPTLIASKSMLYELAQADGDPGLDLMSWQRQLLVSK